MNLLKFPQGEGREITTSRGARFLVWENGARMPILSGGADPTQPPRPPTVSGDLVTISRFLNSPTLVERRLRSMTEKRFVADRLLTARVNASGGAVQYEQSESIFPDRDPESIEPGGEFPLTGLGVGPTEIKAVEKWGIDTKVYLEAVRRQNRNPVDRAMTKLSNGVVRQVDRTALSAIDLAPIQTFAGADWSTASADAVLNQLASAKALITKKDEGFMPDICTIDDDREVDLLSKSAIADAIDHVENPAYEGTLGRLMGLTFLVTAAANMPGTMRTVVEDSNVLGGMAEEEPLSGTSWWVQDTEHWRLRGKRVVVPFVNEPDAACEITGV